MDDLVDCQCCELNGQELRCLLQPRRTSNREHKRTHEFLAQDTGRVLDLFADHVEVLADIVRPLVRSLIKEDAFDVNAVAGGLVVFRPAAVDGHIVEDLLDRSFTVLHPYVTHGRHILLRVEERQLARVIGVGRWGFAGPTVGVDYDQEVQIWVVVDAVDLRISLGYSEYYI